MKGKPTDGKDSRQIKTNWKMPSTGNSIKWRSFRTEDPPNSYSNMTIHENSKGINLSTKDQIEALLQFLNQKGGESHEPVQASMANTGNLCD